MQGLLPALSPPHSQSSPARSGLTLKRQSSRQRVIPRCQPSQLLSSHHLEVRSGIDLSSTQNMLPPHGDLAVCNPCLDPPPYDTAEAAGGPKGNSQVSFLWRCNVLKLDH